MSLLSNGALGGMTNRSVTATTTKILGKFISGMVVTVYFVERITEGSDLEALLEIGG